MDRIIVKLRGGLGNQIFQYAYAEMLAQKYRAQKIILDTSYYNKKHIRGLSFNKYNLPSNIEKNNKPILLYDIIFNFYKLLDKFYFKILKKRLFFSITIGKNGYFFGQNTIKESTKLENIDNLYIGGYFQNELAMRTIVHKTNNDLKIKNELSQKAGGYLKEIEADSNSIAVSIRIGDDYKKFGWPICSKDFYKTGIDLIINKIGDAKVFVFSDCIELVENEKWFEGLNVVFIKECNDVESLYLLKKCNNFVIANSTFSWWGAYLCENKNKLIVAPEFFYNGVKMFESEISLPKAIYLNNRTGEKISE